MKRALSQLVCTVRVFPTNRTILNISPPLRFASNSINKHANPHIFDRTKPAAYILSTLQPEDSDRLENLKKEYEFLIAGGFLMPEKMNDKAWLDILCCSSQYTRRKLYTYLFKLECSDQNKLAKKLDKRRSYEEMRANKSPDANKNMFIRFLEKTTLNQYLNYRLAIHNTFAQPIVYDFSYNARMNLKETQNLAKQMMTVYSANRLAKDPFHLTLTNLRSDENIYSYLRRGFGYSLAKQDNEAILSSSQSSLSDPLLLEALQNEPHSTNIIGSDITDMPWTVTQRSHLELFCDRRIIYLSPNSENVFEIGEYDHDAIYVVGALVDKSTQVPVSLAEARRHRLEHRAIPISRHVSWKRGRKALTLNSIIQMLLTAKDTNGDWAKAVQENVPKRFTMDDENSYAQSHRKFGHLLE